MIDGADSFSGAIPLTSPDSELVTDVSPATFFAVTTLSSVSPM